jgi:hypothetical protein
MTNSRSTTASARIAGFVRRGLSALLKKNAARAVATIGIASSLLGSIEAKADTTTCNLVPGFSLLKLRDNPQPSSTSSWQVLRGGVLAYEINRQELNGIYGGYSTGHGGNPPIDCSDIVVGTDFFAFRLGWQRDLLMAFGVERGSSGLRGLRILRYFAHDYTMALSTSNNELLAVYGWKHDLQARFCWNPENDNRWWHNADHRAGMGACVSNAWPWEYPITSEQEILFD